MVPMPADPVQEEHERPSAGDREREARDRPDENRFQCYSALAPEIFTAKPRFSRSDSM